MGSHMCSIFLKNRLKNVKEGYEREGVSFYPTPHGSYFIEDSLSGHTHKNMLLILTGELSPLGSVDLSSSLFSKY